MNLKKIATAVSATVATFILSAVCSVTAEALEAPVIIGQTDTSSEIVDYQWNPVAGAEDYYTRYSLDGGSTWSEPDRTGLTRDSVYKLYEGASCLVQVYAKNDKEQSAWSAPFELVTIPSKQNIVTDTTGFQTNATTSSVTFTWGNSFGATGYNIYTLSNGKYNFIGTTTTTSFTVGNLNLDSEYRFYVSPYKRSASGYVAERTSNYPGISVTTLAKKPTVKVEIWNDITDSEFLFPETNADGYRVQFYNQKGKVITEKYLGAKSYSDVFLQPGKKVVNYGKYCKVKVASYLDLNNKKVYSGTTTKAFVFQPKVNIKQKTGKLTLSWKKVPKATKYEVYVSYSKNKGYKKVATLKNKKTSYTLNKFKNKKISKDKTYYVYVKPIVKGATSVCDKCFSYSKFWSKVFTESRK